MSRVFNFSAGPATLPQSVLEEAQRDLLDYQGSGMSIMEASHRGAEYSAVHEEAQANIRKLLNVPDEYAILFMQGGASQQFATVPMNLLAGQMVADYTLSGSWAKKAIAEAEKIGRIHIAADTDKDRPTRVPAADQLSLSANAAYVHITSNETISGAQWHEFPKTDAPLVADMSSDILSRPLDVSQFGLIYAGAQKNLGPSGVTVVIMKKELAERAPEDLPSILKYQTFIESDSLYNTPPCFSIYMVMLVTRWIQEQGGLEAVAKANEAKAQKLYDVLDNTDFYSGTAAKEYRSRMNVTFRTPNEDLDAAFVKEAGNLGMKGLKGHRSVGGIRASIYNAFPESGVDALVDFMKEFEKANG